MIRLFEEAHPDIKVNVEFADWNTISEQTVTRAAAGLSPDVMWIREDALSGSGQPGIAHGPWTVYRQGSRFYP